MRRSRTSTEIGQNMKREETSFEQGGLLEREGNFAGVKLRTKLVFRLLRSELLLACARMKASTASNWPFEMPMCVSEFDRDRGSGAQDRRRTMRAIAAGHYSKRTQQAYHNAWTLFKSWCRRHHRSSLPAFPATVASYLLERSRQCTKATVAMDKAAISAIHRDLWRDYDPCKSNEVSDVMQDIRRTKLDERPRRARPLTDDVLADIRATAPIPRRRGRGTGLEPLEVARHRAAFDVALCQAMRDAGLRPSEAANLRWGDLAMGGEGREATLLVRRSKTDQAGKGQVLALSENATKELRIWRSLCENTQPMDPVFGLSKPQIVRRIKAAVAAAGYDAKQFSGNSARIGLVQKMEANGVPDWAIQRQLRWKSTEMISRYGRERDASEGLKYLEQD